MMHFVLIVSFFCCVAVSPLMASNGFVSMFQKMEYSKFIENEQNLAKKVAEKKLRVENERKAEELRRREQERKNLEKQVVKFEGFSGGNDSTNTSTQEMDFFAAVDSAPEGNAVDLKEAVVLPTYELQGILWGTDVDQAIIDGKVYMVGDKINADSELIAVDQDNVVVRYLTHTIIVKIPMMSVTTGDLDESTDEFNDAFRNEGFDDFFDSSGSSDSAMNLTVHEG